MSHRHEPAVTLPWMQQGTTHFSTAVDGLGDEGFDRPSFLPGWSCAHVVGHVARNAEALVRLASWADTGVECPMYESREHRDVEIASTAMMPPDQLRRLLTTTTAELDAALAALDDATWKATVRSALGRTIPAAEIPWMRIREVWLHATDIGADLAFSDFPPGVVDLLLDDTVSALSGRGGCPSVLLAPDDRKRTWTLGPAVEEPHVADLPAAVLAQWLTGRLPDAGGQWALPDVPAWI